MISQGHNRFGFASLFIKRTTKVVLFILVYVDDILVSRSDPIALKVYIHDLDTYFALKTLGSVNHFLGFEAHKDIGGMCLIQSKYTLDLLKKAGMQDCKPCETLVNLGISLTNEGDSFFDLSHYRTIIGSIQYLTYTSPDIVFVVNKLSYFLSSPKVQHWMACKRLL